MSAPPVWPDGESAKQYAPATERNREPILQVLRAVLPAAGTILEIASGSGEHAVYFAAALPHLIWQPSDVDPACLGSIRAWSAGAALSNLSPPVGLDVRQRPWPVPREAWDAVVCINMIHIAPWEACLGLMAGAAAVLRPGSPLLLYGPFKRDGRHTAPSNAAFDAQLRSTDPAFGIRDTAAVTDAAVRHALLADQDVAMPANNRVLVFRKAGAAAA